MTPPDTRLPAPVATDDNRQVALAPGERMVLRSTMTSPYGRKVRIAADMLGLSDRIDIVDASTTDEHDTIRHQNPLGKIPCLLLPDGTPVFDSRVIIEFLQELAGSTQLIPASGPARYRALTGAALADGITDAALLMVYDARFRPGQPPATLWLSHLRGKVERGLAAFEADPPDTVRPGIAAIGLACALGYLDWREPVEWRDGHPGLVDWLDALNAAAPAVPGSYVTAG